MGLSVRSSAKGDCMWRRGNFSTRLSQYIREIKIAHRQPQTACLELSFSTCCYQCHQLSVVSHVLQQPVYIDGSTNKLKKAPKSMPSTSMRPKHDCAKNGDDYAWIN